METSASNLTLHRYKRTNQGFVEDLGNGVTLTLMLIPEGEFLMGAPEDEPDSEPARPQHLVQVSKFLMGQYPVTQIQWKVVAGLSQINLKLDAEPSRFKADNRPVEQVSWYEAMEFCERLSAHTGRNYGLPSESEWEYACRAGTETRFHFGEIITTELVNYYDEDSNRENLNETTLVDHFGMANAFGLCDIHGNVWDWCQDHWHENYEGAPTDGSAWLTENQEENRLIRGGSCYNLPQVCRSFSRYYYGPNFRNIDVGFRVVCRAV
ncbi:hypothetical protein Lepto7375DRAFT_2705 [Leptolyngbya sp. PCC 7375]|nr:hypothetical protein Lepto7375DRAFT_2705 [Leptolyngbya sp. PCC 7375]